MLSKNSTESKAPQHENTGPVAVEEPISVLRPEDTIEGAAGGGGAINDPGGTDTKPPGASDFEHFI